MTSPKGLSTTSLKKGSAKYNKSNPSVVVVVVVVVDWRPTGLRPIGRLRSPSLDLDLDLNLLRIACSNWSAANMTRKLSA